MPVRPWTSGFPGSSSFWPCPAPPTACWTWRRPALAALLWLGRFPPLGVTAPGAADRLCRLHRGLCLERPGGLPGGPGEAPPGGGGQGRPLPGRGLRAPPPGRRPGEPAARALVWTGTWALVALLGAYTLNPVCALIFLLGCVLETGLLPAAQGQPSAPAGGRGGQEPGGGGRGLRRGPRTRRRFFWQSSFSGSFSGRWAVRTSRQTGMTWNRTAASTPRPSRWSSACKRPEPWLLISLDCSLVLSVVILQLAPIPFSVFPAAA